jgi:Fe-S-cluster containining protein
MNLCNQCGACCRVIKADRSPEEIGAMAALTAAIGIPSDFAFIAAHWHALSRDEAMRRNPFYVARLPPEAHLYRCDQLGADGRCLAHDTRPFVCRGYPWYGERPRDMPLADPQCGYAYEQVMEFVVRREDI